MYTANIKNVEMILLLVDLGIDIKSENSRETLTKIILQFAEGGDSKSLETLLSHKSLREVVDINARGYVYGYDNFTILEVAEFQNDIEMLKMLAKYQPNANLKFINKDDKGKAILHSIAKEHSDSEDQSEKAKMKDVMILLILLFNADLTLTDKCRKKPLDYLNDSELRKELEDLSKIDNVINENIEQYISELFYDHKVGFWEKEASKEKRLRFSEYFPKEVFKNLSGIDKKNFFLSIVSDRVNDYYQFIFDFKSWLFEKDQSKSTSGYIEGLSNNFNKLMAEYLEKVHNPAERIKISHSNDNPSTSLDAAAVGKSGESYVMK